MSKPAIVFPEGVTLTVFSNVNGRVGGAVGELSINGKVMPGFIRGDNADDCRAKALEICSKQPEDTVLTERAEELSEFISGVQENDAPYFIDVLLNHEHPVNFRQELEKILTQKPKNPNDKRSIKKVWMHHKERQEREKVLEADVEAKVAAGWEAGRDWAPGERKAKTTKEKTFQFHKVQDDGTVDRVNITQPEIQGYIDKGYYFGNGNSKVKAAEPEVEKETT